MARFKVTPNMTVVNGRPRKDAAAAAPVKRGPGRPRKDAAPVVAAPKAPGKKRGRKPGTKNKSFRDVVGIQADAIEAAVLELSGTLSVSLEKETDGGKAVLARAMGFTSALGETLAEVVTALAVLPENYIPGHVEKKVLAWEKGGFVVFTNPALKELFPDAYEIVSLLAGMIKLEKGLFPKSQLELIDGDLLEAAVPSAPRNGVAHVAVEAIAALAPVEDDLNA